MRESNNKRKMEVEQGELTYQRRQNKADILCIPKELFFPKGKSEKGKLEDFSFDIVVYQEDAAAEL